MDLIEYALIAGFLAVSTSLLLPDFPKNMNLVISKISTIVAGARSRT